MTFLSVGKEKKTHPKGPCKSTARGKIRLSFFNHSFVIGALLLFLSPLGFAHEPASELSFFWNSCPSSFPFLFEICGILILYWESLPLSWRHPCLDVRSWSRGLERAQGFRPYPAHLLFSSPYAGAGLHAFGCGPGVLQVCHPGYLPLEGVRIPWWPGAVAISTVAG